jgi:DNA-binding SARP family transcriptional activator
MIVRGDGGARVPTAAKPRQVLALLLVHANRIVPVASISKELWGDDAPPSAHATVQTYILRLRKVLAQSSGTTVRRVGAGMLVTKVGGYLLRVGPGELDVHRFEQLAAEGRRALSTGDDHGAAALLGDSLRTWRGPALVDVPAGRLLEVHVARLTECYLTVRQQQVEAHLNLGLHYEIIGEITALAAEHPLQENIHAQLILALYRCGRRPDALEVFQRLRRSLIGELGLEPSSKMQRLHHAILAADPVLDGPHRDGGLALDRISGLTQAV